MVASAVLAMEINKRGIEMIALYLGLPGDGKSMSGVRKLVGVLSETNRYVITNLPLEVGELESYLFKEFGSTFNCRERIVVLEQEQVRKFWLIRGGGWRLLDIPEEQYAKNVFPSLQSCYRWRDVTGGAERDDLATKWKPEILSLIDSGEVEEGDSGALGLSACYIIDEAQNFWPARSFQTTPKGLLFYLSQHRHVGDDCIFITQKEGQVEKVVRNLVMEFWVFRNLGQRKRLGFWMPSIFGYTCFPESPSAVGAQFSAVGTFRMDVKGLAACYRTADGVGVGGPTMSADTGRKKRGFTWKMAALIGLVLLIVVIAMPGVLTKLISGVLLGFNREGRGVAHVPSLTNLPALLMHTQAPIVLTQIVVVIPPARRERFSTNDVLLSGAFKGPDGWTVVLRDGRTYGPSDYWKCHEDSSGNLLWVELEQGGQRANWRIAGTGESLRPAGAQAPPSLVPYK